MTFRPVPVHEISRWLCIVASLSILAGCHEPETIEVAGTVRRYHLVPAPAAPSGARPALIVYLHGYDCDGDPSPVEKGSRAVLLAEAARRGAAVLLPRGFEDRVDVEGRRYRTWHGHVDENRQFLARLVPEVVASGGFDPRRVYLIGFTSGGFFVIDAVIDPWERFFAGYAAFDAGPDTAVNRGAISNPATADRRPVFLGVSHGRQREVEWVGAFVARYRPEAPLKVFSHGGERVLTAEAVGGALDFLGIGRPRRPEPAAAAARPAAPGDGPPDAMPGGK